MTDLDLEEYRRYGRQMILPEIGKPGQIALKKSSVLVVGAGGLGCPAIAYLAGAGISRLGIIDADTVSLSNCHRQILYSASQSASHKVHAAAQFVQSLNPIVSVTPYTQRLTLRNAEEIISRFDVVLDCTDNQETRYLISDSCVLLHRPLVSGSALKVDGQLAVYNHAGGPCYRCIFPDPTPEELVESCGDAGILGPVVGVIGVLQALEAIKLITRHGKHGNETSEKQSVCKLTLFSAFADVPWRTIKLRKKAVNCKACGQDSKMSFDSLKAEALLESSKDSTKAVEIKHDRIDASEVASFEGLILDVRNNTQYEITRLPESVNIPINSISTYAVPAGTENVLVVCRNGVDSSTAVQQLGRKFNDVKFQDLRGGLSSYAKFDSTFPFC